MCPNLSDGQFMLPCFEGLGYLSLARVSGTFLVFSRKEGLYPASILNMNIQDEDADLKTLHQMSE